MGYQRRKMWPVNFWTRLDVAFEVVGVQFHQSRNDIVICAIDGAGWDLVPFTNVADRPILNRHRSLDHLIGQNKLRIGKTQVA